VGSTCPDWTCPGQASELGKSGQMNTPKNSNRVIRRRRLIFLPMQRRSVGATQCVRGVDSNNDSNLDCRSLLLTHDSIPPRLGLITRTGGPLGLRRRSVGARPRSGVSGQLTPRMRLGRHATVGLRSVRSRKNGDATQSYSRNRATPRRGCSGMTPRGPPGMPGWIAKPGSPVQEAAR